MKKIISIIALMFVLVGSCAALPRKTLNANVNVVHFRYLQKVQTSDKLDLFNYYYINKVEPQLKMAKADPSYIELIYVSEIMQYYNVDTNKPFFLCFTAHGYAYTVFGMLISSSSIAYFFYKEEM